MKFLRRNTQVLFIIGLLSLWAEAVTYAQAGGGFDLHHHVIAGGGSTSIAGSGFTHGGTIGQSQAGQTGGPTYTVISGFWSGIPSISGCEPGDPDSDGDGICDSGDNCPAAPNADQMDSDGDNVGDVCDNCPSAYNPGQEDTGGIGATSGPDGIGDACQCGDVNGNGRVTIADSVLITRSLLSPPTATQTKPQLCDVGGAAGCSIADSVIILRANLSPPTATVLQHCAPANP